MPQDVAFTTDPHREFTTVIDGETYVIEQRWNARADNERGAWYFDLFTEDRTPIFRGVKIVLGTFLGRHAYRRLPRPGVFVAIDTSRQHREATLDDLGTRVIVRYFSEFDLAAQLVDSMNG